MSININKQLPQLAFLAFSLSLASLSLAEEVEIEEEKPRWFEIELIVIKPSDDSGLLVESWDNSIEISKGDNLVDFLQPYSASIDLYEHGYDPSLFPADTDQGLNASNISIESGEKENLAHQVPNIITESENNTQTDQTLLPGININHPIDTSIVDIHSLDEEAQLLAQLNQLIEEKPFLLLSDDLLQLKNEANSLRRHPEYQVVTHIAWRQPVLGVSEAEHIRIAGGKNYSDEYDYSGDRIIDIEEPLSLQNPLDNIQPDTYNTPDVENNLNLEAFENTAQTEDQIVISDNPSLTSTEELNGDNPGAEPVDELETKIEEIYTPKLNPITPENWVPEVDGDIKIYLKKYLHINTNLFLRRPDREEIEVIDLTEFNSELLQTIQLDSSQAEPLFDAEKQDATSTDLFVLSNDNYEQNTTADNQFQQPSFSQGLTPTNPENHQFSWEIGENFLEVDSRKMYKERLFNYQLKQSRRVRSGELHFFDHPMIGLLIMIRPYELPTESQQQALETENQASTN